MIPAGQQSSQTTFALTFRLVCSTVCPLTRHRARMALMDELT